MNTIKLRRNKSIPFCISILVIITLASCDPARILIVKAGENPNVSVSVYANKNILPHPQGNLNQKIVIQVPATPSSTKRDTTILYGLGGWGDDSLMPEYAKNIDSIVLVNSNGTVVLNDQTEINAYLLKSRHGFAKRILTIEAK